MSTFDPPFDDGDLSQGFSLAPVGLCITRQRQIARCNVEFCRIFGFEMPELENQSLELIYPTRAEFEGTGDSAREPLRATGRYSDDRLMRHRSGRLLWCHVSGRALDKEDPHALAIWMFEDLTERRGVTVDLTTREREIVKLLTLGLSSKQVGKELGISNRTVESHRMRVGQKLNVRTTVEIVAKLSGLI